MSQASDKQDAKDEAAAQKKQDAADAKQDITDQKASDAALAKKQKLANEMTGATEVPMPGTRDWHPAQDAKAEKAGLRAEDNQSRFLKADRSRTDTGDRPAMVGSIVYYYEQASEAGGPKGPFPGIVTAVHPEGICLTIFRDHDLPATRTSIPRKGTVKDGTEFWGWPETF